MSNEEPRWYIGGPGKKPYGPYGFDRLRAFINVGDVKPDSFVLEEGSTQWARADSIPELFVNPRNANEPAGWPKAVPVCNWRAIQRLLPFLMVGVWSVIALTQMWIPLWQLDRIEREHEVWVQAHGDSFSWIPFDAPPSDRRRYYDVDGQHVYLDPLPPFPWTVAREELKEGWTQFQKVSGITAIVTLVIAWPTLPTVPFRYLAIALGWSIRQAGRSWRAMWRWIRTNWKGE